MRISFYKLIVSHIRHAKRLLMAIILLVLSPSLTLSADPDCAQVDGWAANMSFGYLRDAGLTNNYKLDFTKTKVIRLASEKIGKSRYYKADLYRQIHYIIFTEKSGNTIEVITSHEVSDVECAENGIDIFVISKHLGGKIKNK